MKKMLIGTKYSEVDMSKEPTKETCLNCPNHKVINDRDPHDWFCDDDVAVVCSEMPNIDRDPDSLYASDRNPHRVIASSCRPYNMKKESEIPEWCPKKNKKT